ncbi:putative alpha-xylosidase [Xylaria sp. FL1042]|nr:putative alpha-xylosidase [Xylaria sp. FL1042]
MANDLLSDEYIGWRLYVFVAVFTPLQVTLVLLRFYAARLISRTHGADDWLVVSAILGQLVMVGLAIGSVEQGGVGYHVGYLADTHPETIPVFFKYLLAISAWYLLIVNLAKIAVLFVFRRLFPQRFVGYIIYGIGFILVAAPLASLIAVLAACHPFSANWGSSQVQASHCINKEALFVWNSFPNIVTDVAMLGLPLPIVWRLHASTQLKLGLTITFLVGGSGLVASIFRFVAFSRTNSFTDATYSAVELIIWTIAEPGIYLICVCVMMYRPLLEKLPIGVVHTPKLRSWSERSRRPRSRQESGLAENRDIALGNIGVTHHFERLSTPDNYEIRSPEHDGKSNVPNQIIVTTNIDVTRKP